MGFLLSFAIPGLVSASVWLGSSVGYPNALICLPLVVGYVLVPVVQALWRRDPFQVPPAAAASLRWEAYYRVLPLLAVPAQLAMVTVTTGAFVTAPLNTLGRVVLLVVGGVFSAMFAINVAHELIHRRQRLDRFCGGVLLSTVAFGTFKIVHLQIHHPYVGTPLDFATARRDQSIYSFWLVIAVAWWGWAGGLFLLVQGIVAVMYLDCINYLQHYGLTRQTWPGGRPEPMQEHHSWTQGMYLDDLILLNLPRHAHHHTQPQRPFQLLRDTEAAPRYPFNYGVMTILVLFPSVFRRIVHPCLDRFEARRRRDAVAV